MVQATGPGAIDVRTARYQTFFERDGEEIDYDAWLIPLRFEGVRFTMPNPPAHGRALRAHDIHHVLTGYGTDWIGEAEISAFELAGGCGRYVAAFGFDLMGTGLGVLVAPKRTFAAFLRGRQTTNLFQEGYRPQLLDEPVEAVRCRLGLDRDPRPARWGDYAAFAFWGSLGVASIALAPLSSIATALSCLLPAPREE